MKAYHGEEEISISMAYEISINNQCQCKVIIRRNIEKSAMAKIIFWWNEMKKWKWNINQWRNILMNLANNES